MIILTCSFLYFSVVMMVNCSSSILLNRLRKQKTISFQSELSSPIEINIKEDSKFHLTCSFLSNFDTIDIFWLHNGILIRSFISTNVLEVEDNSFLAVSIVSTINLDKISFDMNGFYQCIAVHHEVHAQQTFNVHIHGNKTNSVATDWTNDALITVHTSQALFEPRSYISLMCRYSKDECKTKWFDPRDEPMNFLGENTDLVIQNATFDDNMGLYTCQICCSDQCQKLTSFVYPAGKDE